MTLIITTYIPQTLIMAADSRSVATFKEKHGEPFDLTSASTRFVNSEAAEKLFLLNENTGVGVWGDLFVGGYAVGYWVRAFEAAHMKETGQSIEEIARKFARFFGVLSPVPNLSLLIAGFSKGEAAVWSVEMPLGTVKHQSSPLTSSDSGYGVIRGGDTRVVDRLLSEPRSNPRFDIMVPQTGIDLTRHLMQTAVAHTAFEPAISTIGGPIDVLVLTPQEGKFIHKKELH